MDWKKLMNIKPETLSEQEKDDLCNTLSDFTPDFSVEKAFLYHFVLIIQEILKYKAEQVEYLTNELDEVAARQGKEEGSKLNQYIDEIERLREELEYYKEFPLESGKSGYTSNEELKREMVKLEMQNEELLDELKKLEKDLLNEKDEVEKFAAQVAVLEREKLELVRELKALQDDVTVKSPKIFKEGPEFETEKPENLIEIIREKNKHISQLLEDIELTEEENLSLKTKLTNVRDELSETTTHMTEITSELSTLTHLNKRLEMENTDSAEKIKSLMFQIEELVEEKHKNDKQLDDYIKMFNSKLQEWKDVLNSKDEEIYKLKEEVDKLSLPPAFHSSTDLGLKDMSIKIIQQDKEIKILQEELQKATEEIINSTELIEKLKEKNFQLISMPQQDQSLVSHYENKIKFLEEKLIYAEEDATAKAEEMSGLVIQLREYETGVFGLSEAVSKIKKLEKQLEQKTLQIEKLVDICNNLEIKVDSFEEQNMGLRERLGLSASDEIDTTGVKLKYKKEEELLETMKLQLERKEEELVQTKLKYRKLVKFLKLHPLVGVNFPPEKSTNLKCHCFEEKEKNKKLHGIIKENEALRKGMHEILESIRQQDGCGTVQVQSACLERLLEALDSRHVSGWYHPAMRLQAQLSTEEGKNEELRSQIRSLKTEEKKRASELQNAYLKIQSLENESSPRLEEEKTMESRTSESSSETEAKDEIPLLNVDQEKRIIALESELQDLRCRFDGVKAEKETLERNFVSEKENLLSEVARLESQIQVYKNENPVSDFSKLAELTSEGDFLKRKVNFLQNWEAVLRQNNENMRREMLDDKEKMLEQILKLQSDKSKLLNTIEKLEEDILSRVSRDRYLSLKGELSNAEGKYQRAVNLFLAKDEEDFSEVLRAEIEMLQKEKQELFVCLKSANEKLITAETLLKEKNIRVEEEKGGEISNLAEKLAELEIRELNEKQKIEHLEQLNNALTTEENRLRTRNNELLEEITNLTENVEKLREAEKSLRSKDLNRFSAEDDQPLLLEKINVLQERCAGLAAEKENIQELFEISQGQCRAFKEWKNSDKILLASMNEQILTLQASSDGKAAVSRLSHELTEAKLTNSRLSQKNKDLEKKVSKLLAQNADLEARMSEKCRELVQERKKHLAFVDYLFQSLDEVRNLYGCSVKFRHLEEILDAKAELKRKNKELQEKSKELKNQIQDCCQKKEEMEIQLSCLEDLKLAFEGESENLIRWHNKNTELRLKEAKCRRQNEFLAGEISQLERNLKKLSEEMAALEEENAAKEIEWEDKQKLWEKAQLQMRQLLKEGFSKKKLKKFADASTNTIDLEEAAVTRDRPESPDSKSFAVKVRELEAEVAKLRKEGKEKDEIIEIKEQLLKGLQSIRVSRNVVPVDLVCKEAVGNPEREALKVTVESFQNIIKQKEETILRYRDLLKESREKYGSACAKFQSELKELNEALAAQSLAFNRMKNAAQSQRPTGENISGAVEKFVGKIHELEEELRESQMNFSNANTQVTAVKEEMDKWKALAEERLSLVEDTRQRFEEEYKSEMENYKEEIRKKQKEIDRLNQHLESLRNEIGNDGGSEDKLVENIQHLRVNLLDRGNDKVHVKSDQLSDCTFDKSERQKNNQLTREVEILKEKLNSSKEESARLKEQIRLLQFRSRRPKTSGSSDSRTDSNAAAGQDDLPSKVKRLEELLMASKEREMELMDMNQKKLKSVEEVTRWDERKKSQQTIQQLTAKLKDKEAEVNVLKNKNESFRNMVYKCEKDKSALESRLKVAKGSSAGGQAIVEKLTAEKNQLEAEAEALRAKLEEQTRHSEGIGAVLLRDKLEEQERKLAAFELASKGQNVLIQELERLKSINSNLEKANLKLESENLALRIQLETEKAETKFLLGTIKKNRDLSEVGNHKQSDETIFQLKKKIVDLSEENKRLRLGQKEPSKQNLVDKMRLDFSKLSKDHKSLRVKYMEAMDRNVALEKEVKSCRYQIQLMEEKDLAEILAGPNNALSTSQLSRELIEVKTKLAQKTHLLSRVKALLLKAAAKEKALHQEVCFLQAKVPKSALHSCV